MPRLSPPGIITALPPWAILGPCMPRSRPVPAGLWGSISPTEAEDQDAIGQESAHAQPELLHQQCPDPMLFAATPDGLEPLMLLKFSC